MVETIAALALLTVFVGLLAMAGWHDFRHLIIPNGICAALVVLYVPFALATGVDPLAGLATGLATFAAGAALFALGWFGGGDVKLLAATALWAGPVYLPALLVIVLLSGGAFAMIEWFRLGHVCRRLANAGRVVSRFTLARNRAGGVAVGAVRPRHRHGWRLRRGEPSCRPGGLGRTVMRARVFVLLAVAVVAGGGAVVGANQWLAVQRAAFARTAEPAPEPAGAAAEILVARNAMPAGLLI